MIPFYKNLFLLVILKLLLCFLKDKTDNKQVVLKTNNLPTKKTGNRDVIIKCRFLSAQVFLRRVSHIFPFFAVALGVWPFALMGFGAGG